MRSISAANHRRLTSTHSRRVPLRIRRTTTMHVVDRNDARFASHRHQAVLVLILLAVLSTVTPAPAFAAGPCKATGSTLHAQLRMSTRDTSRKEVAGSVKVHRSRGRWQASTGTWVYQGAASDVPKRPVVVMNRAGMVVTAWWPAGAGGGGARSHHGRPAARPDGRGGRRRDARQHGHARRHRAAQRIRAAATSGELTTAHRLAAWTLT